MFSLQLPIESEEEYREALKVCVIFFVHICISVPCPFILSKCVKLECWLSNCDFVVQIH